ncbi:hypothetical protein ACFX13_044904 [Malus domestica]
MKILLYREDERGGMALGEEGLENAATETRGVGFGEFGFTSGSEYCQQVLQRSLLPLLFGIKKIAGFSFAVLQISQNFRPETPQRRLVGQLIVVGFSGFCFSYTDLRC